MNKTDQNDENQPPPFGGLSSSGVSLMSSMADAGGSCCPEPAGPDYEKPGYLLCHYVEEFIETPAGDIPRISTRLCLKDRLATAAVRCGIHRYQYRVAPGLYAVGNPDAGSEVLVTANFKLTFDILRKELTGLNLWILVLDTKGINVWCAAGKGTFATSELVARIASSSLARVVDHRRLIVPQLGATGVSAKAVKAQSGFKVVYGPIRAQDIPEFLAAGRKATQEMREVTFGFWERVILTPVEVQIVLKPALITALAVFILSGIGPGIFSFSAAWTRGMTALSALLVGIMSGAVVTPALLPFIPVREFALKGIISGIAAALLLMAFLPPAGFSASLALVLFTIAISSFLAMNFTGTTPFTSPSGVEKEMKRYMPVQMICLVLSFGFWIYGGF